MQQPIRTLNAANISAILEAFTESIAPVGSSIQGLTGVSLLTALKRKQVGLGPYPSVTLFEAANRIMSDLVILHGIAGLLKLQAFPFTEYTVEFGNEDKNGFDIRATSDSCSLAGEAFNVAPSFFHSKKASALKKLRSKAADSTHRIIMFNAGAPSPRYSARHEPGIYYVCVDINSGDIEITPRLPT
ncbi:hypothetical protein [Pseudomonas sp. TTU2014-080ASC]|uniref:hypothetical protein n=1 Tax=Pseudomonas sp. TTU2014-080ASC TaxID=1729724 RepID=UPI0009EC4A72|nr:hypothetical protein [Pseudomonas sp. TTU2014-080ASC]